MVLVQKELKNAYIWEYQEWWQPWANTLAYYPLAEDAKDYSGNGRDGTNSWVTFSDGLATFSSARVSIPSDSWNYPSANFTISVWARAKNWVADNMYIVGKLDYYATSMQSFFYNVWITYSTHYATWWFATWSDYNTYPWASTVVIWLDERHLYTLTNDWTTKTLYLDKTQVAQATANTTTSTISMPLTIWAATYRNNNAYFDGNIKDVIIENKTWSLQDISDYYDNNQPS